MAIVYHVLFPCMPCVAKEHNHVYNHFCNFVTINVDLDPLCWYASSYSADCEQSDAKCKQERHRKTIGI